MNGFAYSQVKLLTCSKVALQEHANAAVTKLSQIAQFSGRNKVIFLHQLGLEVYKFTQTWQKPHLEEIFALDQYFSV